jgi:hypothetical protein
VGFDHSEIAEADSHSVGAHGLRPLLFHPQPIDPLTKLSGVHPEIIGRAPANMRQNFAAFVIAFRAEK